MPTATKPPGAATSHSTAAAAKMASALVDRFQSRPSDEYQAAGDGPLSSIATKPSCHTARLALGAGPAGSGHSANPAHGPETPDARVAEGRTGAVVAEPDGEFDGAGLAV
jgi:hypothetical protein